MCKMKKQVTRDFASESVRKMWIQEHWILCIIAAIFYLGGILYPYIFIENIAWENFLPEVCRRIGEAILISGIISFFSNHRTIVDGYRNELKSLLFSSEYLESKANDIWERISEIVCETKFPTIAKELLYIVKNNYMQSNDNIRCYHNYDNTIKIEWESDDKSWIKVTDISEFDLYTDSEEEITLSQTNNIAADSEHDNTWNDIELISENQPGVKKEGTYNPRTGYVECENHIKLRGATQYRVIKNMHRRYNIKNDNFIGFRAQYITDGMSLKISHPSDMKLTMVEMGTINRFKKNIINENTCEYQYNGLILPKQGYVIIMSN